MKHLCVLLLLSFTAVASWGQSFEGQIVYANSYKSKAPNVTDEQWTSMLGTTQDYFIKGGEYKSVANGQLVQWQLFRNQENKLYTKLANSELALWNDAAANEDSTTKAEVKKGVAEVLGYKCDELTLTCKSGVQKYYYSSKLAVDPKLFINHKYGNWYEVLKTSNAIPLRMVIETPQFTMECVATAVKPMKLDAKLFELPVGLQSQKSPH